MTQPRTAGFTLVELMIGLAIAALLVVLALPSYQVWIADAQIRNAAESIASGLRYAQSQAVARNSTIEFVLNPIVGTGGWTAQQIDRVTCGVVGTPLQLATFQEGANLAAFAVLPAGATKVQFSSLGVIEAPCDGSGTLDSSAGHVRDRRRRRTRPQCAGAAAAAPASRSATRSGRPPTPRAVRPDRTECAR